MPPKAITELSKPSLLNNVDLFAQVTIAICDPDVKMAALVKRILTPLGCKRIHTMTNPQTVIDLMREEQVDMVITEWEMSHMSGIEMTHYLRRSVDSPNRMVPIIMLTRRNENTDIRIARDAGISEYLIKPFSAKTLMERVYAVVEEPRSLIICKSFVGPDRRRQSSLSVPDEYTGENMPYMERRPPVIMHKEQLSQIILDDMPRMVLPDYTLKKKIGFEVPSELIVNPLTIAKSEDEIKSVREEFITSVMRDVNDMSATFQILVTSPDNAKKLVKTIQDAAELIASRAGVFGYIRATEVAGQLATFCRKHYDKENKYHLIILEKHIQTIMVIFGKNVTDDGGPIGAELMRDLSKLIQKYLHRKD